MRIFLPIVVALLVVPAAGQDDSAPYHARYLSGHDAFKGNFACHLAVTSTEFQIRIYAGIKGRDEVKLAVPITQVVSATITLQDHDKIIVVTKTNTAIEALYFDVQDHNAPAVVAKIDSARKKAGEARR